MVVLQNPFFYALIALFGLCMSSLWFSSKKLGGSWLYGATCVAIFAIGRLLLPMPFVVQPRLEISDVIANVVGWPILILGLVLCLIAALQIKPVTAPDRNEPLKTTGLYGIVRHPIIVGEIIWPLGLSILMASTIGMALTAFWFLILYVGTRVEEEQMEQIFGDEYREYKRRVPGYIPLLKGLRIKDEKRGSRSMSLRDRWVELLYRALKSSPKRRALITPVGIVFWLSLTALFVFASIRVDGLAHFPRFVSPPLSLVIGSILLALWAFIALWPVVRFFRARGSPVPLNPPQELVTTGLYAYVRNPMVSGWLSGMFGLGVLLGSISLTFIFTPFFAILNVIYLKAIEERELEKKFGEEYLRYKEKVPMFIPRLRK